MTGIIGKVLDVKYYSIWPWKTLRNGLEMLEITWNWMNWMNGNSFIFIDGKTIKSVSAPDRQTGKTTPKKNTKNIAQKKQQKKTTPIERLAPLGNSGHLWNPSGHYRTLSFWRVSGRPLIGPPLYRKTADVIFFSHFWRHIYAYTFFKTYIRIYMHVYFVRHICIYTYTFCMAYSRKYTFGNTYTYIYICIYTFGKTYTYTYIYIRQDVYSLSRVSTLRLSNSL